MKQTLSELLRSSDDAVVEQVFGQVSGVKKLRMLCEGLRLFLSHFLLNSATCDDALRRKTQLAERSLDSRNYQVRM